MSKMFELREMAENGTLKITDVTREQNDKLWDYYYDEWDEVEKNTEQERFCEYCRHIRTTKEMEEYWGSTCYREVATCPADFDPTSEDCPEYEEFKENLRVRDIFILAMDTIDNIEIEFQRRENKNGKK